MLESPLSAATREAEDDFAALQRLAASLGLEKELDLSLIHI